MALRELDANTLIPQIRQFGIQCPLTWTDEGTVVWNFKKTLKNQRKRHIYIIGSWIGWFGGLESLHNIRYMRYNMCNPSLVEPPHISFCWYPDKDTQVSGGVGCQCIKEKVRDRTRPTAGWSHGSESNIRDAKKAWLVKWSSFLLWNPTKPDSQDNHTGQAGECWRWRRWQRGEESLDFRSVTAWSSTMTVICATADIIRSTFWTIAWWSAKETLSHDQQARTAQQCLRIGGLRTDCLTKFSAIKPWLWCMPQPRKPSWPNIHLENQSRVQRLEILRSSHLFNMPKKKHYSHSPSLRRGSRSKSSVKKVQLDLLHRGSEDETESVSIKSNDSDDEPIEMTSVYDQLLPNNPKAIAFLFSSRFREALEEPLLELTSQYELKVEDAIEELRRFLAIKTYTVDTGATKTSPTPLSK